MNLMKGGRKEGRKEEEEEEKKKKKRRRKKNIFFQTFFLPSPSFAFESHLIHHVLAAYALGASASRLQEIFVDHASYQRPLPPSQVQLTRDNWTQHLGKKE